MSDIEPVDGVGSSVGMSVAEQLAMQGKLQPKIPLQSLPPPTKALVRKIRAADSLLRQQVRQKRIAKLRKDALRRAV